MNSTEKDESDAPAAKGFLGWLNHRTGLNQLLHTALDEPIPGARASLTFSGQGCSSFSFLK